jgi:protein gp37
MAAISPIEWTDATWNPVTGCTKISAGCTHCYAERMAERLRRMGQPRYGDGFRLTLQPDLVALPLTWRKPRTIFVNSMSDLFHQDVPASFIADVFETMERASWHTFQVLTKRADRLHALSGRLPWPGNVWQGVSVEGPKVAWRIDELRGVPAAVRFLSVEPFLAALPDLDLTGIDWVIVGGESGPAARPMDPAWVREVRASCQAQGVAFFFKQWGGVNKAATGRELDGRTWDAMPTPTSRWAPAMLASAK